jgi:hypothetical protein
MGRCDMYGTVVKAVMDAGGGGGMGSLACLRAYSGGARDVMGGAGCGPEG